MSKKQTLADRISNLLSTTPQTFDPEETNDEETAAKVTEGALEDNEDVEETILSSFRKKNIQNLDEVDVKYSGKKGSRRNLKGSEDEWETDEEIKEKSDSESEEQEDKEEDDNDDDEGSEEGISVDDEESGEGMSVDDEEEQDRFKHINEVNISNQMKKGLCVRNQLNIWENLLEMRIQMQKSLIAANKMPQKEYYNSLIEDADDDFKEKIKGVKSTLGNTLNKLLNLQSLVWKKYPETKNIFDNKSLNRKNQKEILSESDEEIPSDTDEEKSESDENSSDEMQNNPPKKPKKLDDFETELNTRHMKYKDYRNSVIQKWNDKTRIASSKSNIQHSVLNQIDHILSDKSRLIKRTQTKRSNYQIIGIEDNENDDKSDKNASECNPEIFDDDDFYHQLLRELIEVKSADVTDPVQLGRQWIQLQNLRSKMKRKIDTRATKGRKIRYTVHPKLVNFMAPIDEGYYTEDAKNELFSSLCGKNQIVHKL